MSKAGVVTSGAAGFAGSSTTGCAAEVDWASEAGATTEALSASCGPSCSEASPGAARDVSCLLNSLADTAPFPKNMNRAATATLAAPKLYLRIE